jgi:4'-phosphopantetheinyl transferase
VVRLDDTTVTGAEAFGAHAAVGGRVARGAEAPAHGRPVSVHVASTRLTQAAQARAISWLSADERRRAARLRFARDRERFIAARAWLRTILGAELDVPPRVVRFRYEPNGKPALDAAGTGADGNVAFNLSHAGDVVLVAVGRGCRIGVDVERILDDLDTRSLEPHCLAGEEIAALAALPTVERRRAFFRCWTRKEAYLKGVGTGLAGPLDQVSIVAEGAGGGLVVHDAARGAPWHVRDLPAPSGYAAALAIDAPRAVLAQTRINDAKLEVPPHAQH